MGLKSWHCAARAHGSAAMPPCTMTPAPLVSASLPHSPASHAALPLPAPTASTGCRRWVPTALTATSRFPDRTPPPSLLLHRALSRPPLPPPFFLCLDVQSRRAPSCFPSSMPTGYAPPSTQIVSPSPPFPFVCITRDRGRSSVSAFIEMAPPPAIPR
jgi:hypothetical protein